MIRVKTVVRKVHLVLGLASGLVVFMLAVTGCMYTFEQEITHILRKDDIIIQPQPIEKMPLSLLWQQTQDKVGDEKISWAEIYNDPAKSWVFTSLKKNKDAITYFGSIDYYTSTYVNPYTGEILGIYDEEKKFLNIVKYLHWSLLLKTEYGQPIIGWSTFIFVIMLISGIILWWPKNKKSRKKRFWFFWKKRSSWKRKNYDLHSILGFYIAPVVLVIALSGMLWAFPWFKSLLYDAGSETPAKPDPVYTTSIPIEQKKVVPLDKALQQSKKHHSTAAIWRVTPPKDSTGSINVVVQQKEGAYFVRHNLRFNQYNGGLLATRSHEDKNFGEKLSQGNYDIHTGIILGIPGKILVFIASLVCASLPVTGFILWYRRIKKVSYKTSKIR